MKYYYQRPDFTNVLYGEIIDPHHPVIKACTLYLDDQRGICVVQKRFDPNNKTCYLDALDPWLANDIYLNQRFSMYFNEHSSVGNYPIIPVRQLMWALRMKPLRKESWEEWF